MSIVRVQELDLDEKRCCCGLKELVLHIHSCPKLAKSAKLLGQLQYMSWVLFVVHLSQLKLPKECEMKRVEVKHSSFSSVPRVSKPGKLCTIRFTVGPGDMQTSGSASRRFNLPGFRYSDEK